MLILALACAASPSPAAAGISAASPQNLRASGSDLALSVLLTDPDGDVVPCGTSDLSVGVSVASGPQGPWTPLAASAVTTSCGAAPPRVALVVDNSGSEADWLSALQWSADHLVDAVLAAGGEAGLVRVSTEADVEVPLTADADELHAAVADLHVKNGWTALWDGVRAGAELLGEAQDPEAGVCTTAPTTALLAFTDGHDNNSADEQDYDHAAYPGDSIPTTLDALATITDVPVFPVGLGDDVDADALSALASATGGRFAASAAVGDIEPAFARFTAALDGGTQVCAALPAPVCGPVWVRTTSSWSDADGAHTVTDTRLAHVACDEAPAGRVATVLLDLAEVPAPVAAPLAVNAARWVGAGGTRVLVLRDDQALDPSGAAGVVHALRGAGFDVTLRQEPVHGVTLADLEPYDTVWLSAGGQPVDDDPTIVALEAFSAEGGGVILEGDDASRTWTRDLPLAPLTRLDFDDNGNTFCGAWTDAGGTDPWHVRFSGDHPLLTGLDGKSFDYADDIDVTLPRGEGEVVLASASLPDHDDCGDVPVVIGWGS